MGKQVGDATYWLGCVCAALSLVARAFDVFGVNLIGIATKGGEITYHTFMDATLFFYAISIATKVYFQFPSQPRAASEEKESAKIPETAMF